MKTRYDLDASLATLDTTEGHTQSYNGVSIWKSAADLKRYEAIFSNPDTRPDTLIETGTRWGGFALWAADRFGIEVWTIDIQRTRGDATRHPGVMMVVADSADSVTIYAVADRVRGRKTMVILDSDHHAGHVEKEIRGYAPIVSPGCYLVVEDTVADLADVGHARQIGARIPEEGGPLRALDAQRGFLTEHGFALDKGIEDLYPITHSPQGWWRRER